MRGWRMQHNLPATKETTYSGSVHVQLLIGVEQKRSMMHHDDVVNLPCAYLDLGTAEHSSGASLVTAWRGRKTNFRSLWSWAHPHSALLWSLFEIEIGFSRETHRGLINDTMIGYNLRNRMILFSSRGINFVLQQGLRGEFMNFHSRRRTDTGHPAHCSSSSSWRRATWVYGNGRSYPVGEESFNPDDDWMPGTGNESVDKQIL